MTSLMMSQRDVKVCLLYSCLSKIVTFSPWMLWHSFTKFHTQMQLGWVQGPVYFQGQRSNNWVTRSQDRSNGCRGVKSISIISQYMQSYWFSIQSKINMIYNISVITITITMSIILANFGKYAISDCPFITCQNLQFLASMFVCRFVTCQNFQFLQVCSFVGLSVCLSVLSSITHERFDISSPNLVHIWNGWAVPVCDIDK